jgi:hypothetical protein
VTTLKTFDNEVDNIESEYTRVLEQFIESKKDQYPDFMLEEFKDIVQDAISRDYDKIFAGDRENLEISIKTGAYEYDHYHSKY